jgi:hypothetical protein
MILVTSMSLRHINTGDVTTTIDGDTNVVAPQRTVNANGRLHCHASDHNLAVEFIIRLYENGNDTCPAEEHDVYVPCETRCTGAADTYDIPGPCVLTCVEIKSDGMGARRICGTPSKHNMAC